MAASICVHKCKLKTICYAGDERKQITVLISGTASGFFLRPLILYDAVKALDDWIVGTKNDIVVFSNQSGIMDPPIFRKYIVQIIVPYIDSLNLPISEQRVIQ